MTVRTDLTYNLLLSPRLITVQSPSTEITLQDLLDTTRIFEAESASMDDGHLINAAGKEELGGGVLVGITATLQNAQLAFEGRDIATSTGTATSNNAAGTLLTDIGATFVIDGVVRGATIINCTSGASAEVLSVTANALTHTALESGSRQDWLISDAYTVHNIIQVNISGGNLTAIDNVGASLDPVFSTAYTQVVRTASSSATLQQIEAIEFASFNRNVAVDLINGTSGTSFPTGTLEQPVDNFVDALTIANSRGLEGFFIIGDATLTGLDFSDFNFTGQSPNKTTLTIDASATVTGVEMRSCTLTGILAGGAIVERCQIATLTFLSGFIGESLLVGPITLNGNTTAHFLNCWSGVPGLSTPILDMGGSGQELAMRNYSGGITIINKTGADNVSLDLSSGHVILDPTVTNGTIVVRGLGKLTDNSSGNANVESEDFVTGSLLKLIERILRNRNVTDPSDGRFILYDDDDGEMMDSNVFEDVAGITPYGPDSQEINRRDRLDFVNVFDTEFGSEFR